MGKIIIMSLKSNEKSKSRSKRGTTQDCSKATNSTPPLHAPYPASLYSHVLLLVTTVFQGQFFRMCVIFLVLDSHRSQLQLFKLGSVSVH